MAERIPTIQELGLPEACKTMVEQPCGLLLVAGPPDSGRSITIKALTDRVMKIEAGRSVATIEDGIESHHQPRKGTIRQIDAKDQQALDDLLATLMEDPPDVLVIDSQHPAASNGLMMQMAELDCLVLAAVPGIDALSAIDGFLSRLDSGEDDLDRVRLADAMVGVISQRLLPRKSGKGLVLALEVLVGTLDVRQAISECDSTRAYSLIETGSKRGMFTMNASLLRLFREGIITRKTAMGASPGIDQLQRYVGWNDDDDDDEDEDDGDNDDRGGNDYPPLRLV